MTTQGIFKNHNAKLMHSLIDDELPEAYFCIDPNDPIFDKPLP